MAALFCNFKNNLSELFFLLHYQSEAGSKHGSKEKQVSLCFTFHPKPQFQVKHISGCNISASASLSLPNHVSSVSYLLMYHLTAEISTWKSVFLPSFLTWLFSWDQISKKLRSVYDKRRCKISAEEETL